MFHWRHDVTDVKRKPTLNQVSNECWRLRLLRLVRNMYFSVPRRRKPAAVSKSANSSRRHARGTATAHQMYPLLDLDIVSISMRRIVLESSIYTRIKITVCLVSEEGNTMDEKLYRAIRAGLQPPNLGGEFRMVEACSAGKYVVAPDDERSIAPSTTLISKWLITNTKPPGRPVENRSC